MWILLTKLVPTYYNKLDSLLVNIGRYRDLPSWRKEFKKEWKKCIQAKITLPLNDKYRPDPVRWVCTCPYYVTSRFLLCKHLVQSVHPVHPIFFLEVTRNRKSPFWSHPSLIPLNKPFDAARAQTRLGPNPDLEVSAVSSQSSGGNEDEDDEYPGGDEGDASDEDDVIDTQMSNVNFATYDEDMTSLLTTLKDFYSGLEYQKQFRDHRFLDIIQREGAGFLRLANNCLSRERRQNSTRSAAPNTWERTTANAMLYRPRPPHVDANS